MNPDQKESTRVAIGKFLAIVALGLTTTIYGGLTLAGGSRDVDPGEVESPPVVEQRAIAERGVG